MNLDQWEDLMLDYNLIKELELKNSNDSEKYL